MTAVPNGIAGMVCAGIAGFLLARHNYIGAGCQLLFVVINVVMMVRFAAREGK